MAVEAISEAGAPERRTEFQRAQQRLSTELAERAAQKVAVQDKEALTTKESDALQERQTTSSTVQVGRQGSSLDLVV